MTHKELVIREKLSQTAKGVAFEKLATIRGLPYRQIAKELGVSFSAVSMFKSGERSLSEEAEKRLLEILRIDLNVWNYCIRNVIDFLYKDKDINSVELWYLIINKLRRYDHA